jgi:hypothetical protein
MMRSLIPTLLWLWLCGLCCMCVTPLRECVDGKKVFVIGHSGYPKTGPVKSEVDQNGGKRIV